LIDPSKPASVRIAGWELLTECAKCTSSTDRERREFFQTLTARANPEDFHLQLAAVVDLTNHGRNVAGFYYDIFPLLTGWLEEAYKAARVARRNASRGASKSSKGKALSSGEDKNFSQLFAFLRDIIKFNFKFALDNVVGQLIDMLLFICMNTSLEDDLAACISVIDALVTFGTIPNDKLKECIHVLSSIHCLVPNRQKDAWHTLSNICKSHHGQSTVRILLDVLRKFPAAADKEKDNSAIREARGAITVLKKLLSKSAEKGYPGVPLALLVDGLANLSKSNSTRLSTEIIKLINSLLDGPDGNPNSLVVEEHWTPFLTVAAHCAAKGVQPTVAREQETFTHALSTKDEHESGDSLTYQMRFLINRVENLLLHRRSDLLQRDECIAFFTEVHQALPDSAAAIVLDHFKEYRSYLPSEVEWKKNLKLVLEGFYLDRTRNAPIRLQALGAVAEVYDFLCLVPDLVEGDAIADIIKRVLSGMSSETDTVVLQETVTFLVDVAEAADDELFDWISDAFRDVIAAEMSSQAGSSSTLKPSSPYASDPRWNQSLSNVVTRGYVQIFTRLLCKDASKAVRAFTALVHIARSNSVETDARISAMKMLFRLRADFEHKVFLTTTVENVSLAASLHRTEASLARKLAEDAAQPSRLARADPSVPTRPTRGLSFSQAHLGERNVPIRSMSTPKPLSHQNQRLWSVPDADALPEPPPERSSHVLLSHRESTDAEASSEGLTAVLNMGNWLEALLSIFHQGCDWEVYSFVLVHLPAQLSNHPIFRDALSHVEDLRRVICEMIRMNSFQEPPLSTGLRRPDVANCLFHSLIMIVSYHQHLQKLEEDEIVRTFTHGISDKTAKTCIHALSVCCHELPLSVSKSLIAILQRMSQVITQPFVAMHILEFLACLSRLHALYSNFREDEYRIVFAICFRYLQYVRDKKHSTRGTYTSEPSTPSAGSSTNLEILGQQSVADDLPQYVYALAYHVITFWFLAVKLPDRPNHIGWIAKNLFTDVDGTASNEEQAQITLDFMQRVTFSDASDSAEDPNFKQQHFGTIQQKRWIIGNSIVTIRQAEETGWAEITRRYPSGTSSFAIRVEFTPMTSHAAVNGSDSAAWEGRFQTGTTIFPSHLLMQLLAPMPQIYDIASRPIPLPDEDAVDRAIRLFDRNSTVDGHKVGVIYIGDGQTQETEILANTIGGPDYLEFLKGLGVLTRLKGATFNTQGLDREHDIDGQYTYCWRDRVTEIVFHVITQMPTNLKNDPQCIMKKRHIGNDFVNIVFNDSGMPFKFDTFPSQFNYVYIVITPTPRSSFVAVRELAKEREDESEGGNGAPNGGPFFMVQVMSQPGFPEISPASEPKMISLKALPSFVRMLALNASVFSSVWANREGGEHISSWRNRLREIGRLREKYGPKSAVGIIQHQQSQQWYNLHQSTSSPPANSLGVGIGGASTSSLGGQMNNFYDGAPSQGSGGGGGGLHSHASSRPVSSVRDSFTSLRRSSVATFFTTGTGSGNHISGTAGTGISSSGTTDSSTATASHRSSAISNSAAVQASQQQGGGNAAMSGENGGTTTTEIMMIQGGMTMTNGGAVGGADALVDSVDFSKWT